MSYLDGVGHAGWGVSYRMGFVMQGWGVIVGRRCVIQELVGWVMQGWVGWVMQGWGGSYRGGVG